MRCKMLDELDQQHFFSTVIEDGHNGEFDLTKVSDDPWLSVEAAADAVADYTPEQERILAVERMIRHAVRDATDVLVWDEWTDIEYEFDQDPAGFCRVN